MAKRIQLEVSPAMAEYARAHGAAKDASGRWFGYDPLPNELEGFRIKAVREPGYEYQPSCPECGRSMVKRVSRTSGYQVWGCSGYPQCTGKLHVADTSQAASSLAVSGLRKELLPPQPVEQPRVAKVNIAGLKERWLKIVQRAEVRLGDAEKAAKWLQAPNPELGKKRPIDLLGTPSGCDVVERLIG